MAISGALAGGLAVNEVMGVQHRLLLDFTAGYGFVGIAVAPTNLDPRIGSDEASQRVHHFANWGNVIACCSGGCGQLIW